MRLMLCGKGGCGKSTTTTLLAKEFERQGKRVLVIDCDESNYGLHQQLGLELPRDFADYVGGKERVMMLAGDNPMNMAPLFDKPMTFDDVPADYVSKKGRLLLMSPGKIQNANEGCACAFNIVMAHFLPCLQLMDDDVVLMDMEAGIEHFGRGTANICENVLMVVDPSYESLRLSKKIQEIAESVGHTVAFVLNKVDESNREMMLDLIADPDKIGTILSLNKDLAAAGLQGKELTEPNPEIQELVSYIMTKMK